MPSPVIAASLLRLPDSLPLCSLDNTPTVQEHTCIQELQRRHPELWHPSKLQESAPTFCTEELLSGVLHALLDSPRQPVVFILLFRKEISLPVGSTRELLLQMAAHFSTRFSSDSIREANTPYAFGSFSADLKQQTYNFESRLALGVEKRSIPAVDTIRSSEETSMTSGAHGEVAIKLGEVESLLRSNLNDMVLRGETLETMSHYSAELKEHSAKFRHRAVKLNRPNWRARAVSALSVLFFIFLLYWRFIGL